MEVKKINFVSSVGRSVQPNFKGEEEFQTETKKSSNGTKNVVTALSLLAAIGAAGIAVYKHKNLDEAVEKAKKEAQKKIEEAEEKAKKAAEDAEKKIKEALEKAKQESKTGTEKHAENPKKTTKSEEPILNIKNKRGKKAASPKVKIETEVKTEIKPETKIEKPEIKSEVKTETKPEVKIEKPEAKSEVKTETKPEVKIEKPEIKSEVKTETKEVKPQKPETKPIKPEQKTETKQEKSSADTVNTDETKFTVKDERRSIKFLNKKFKKIIKKLQTQKAIQTEKLLRLNKSIDELGTAIKELKNAADNLLKKRSKSGVTPAAKKPEVKPELPAVTDKKPEVKPETKPELPAAADKKPEVKPEKQHIEADKPRVITLEGGIKDSKLKKVDKTLLKQIEESKNGIIVIPRRTKLSELVQKGQDYIIGKISGLRKKFKGKTAWQLELEEDKKRYTKLVEKAKELNKKAEENKKYVAELEKKLDGSISVTIPQKPTNIQHIRLQKEYDKLAIAPEKRVHKTLEELKEQITDAWNKTTKSKVEELEKKLDGSISVTIPQKPTNIQHIRLQKEYDKLAIAPEKRVHKTHEELKEQIIDAWNKTTKSKVEELEKKLDGSISVTIPQKPTNIQHIRLQKEYDKLAIAPEKRVHKTHEELKEQITDAWNKTTRTKVQELEKKLDGSISVSVPQEPTRREHIDLQKEYNKLAIKRKTKKSKPKAKTVRRKVTKTLIDVKEKLMSIWKKQTDAVVKALEKKLDGSISVSVPQEPTRREHIDLQKEYNKLAIKRKKGKTSPAKKIGYKAIVRKKGKASVDKKDEFTGLTTDVRKTTDVDLLIEYNLLKNKVKNRPVTDTASLRFLEIQGELTNHRGYRFLADGSIKKMKTPQKPTNIQHKHLQEEYDNSAIMPQKPVYKSLLELKEQIASFWKKQSDNKVKELEKELNGNITVNVPKKPTDFEHKQLQKEYDNLSIEQKSDVAANQPIENQNAVIEQGNKPKGLNELPESFNRGERVMIKYVYKHTDAPIEKVTEYPKLYATKNDRKNATKTIFTYMTKYMWKDMFELSQAPSGNFWNDMRTPGISPIIRFKEYFKLLKEEKNAKNAYEKAKKEHIERRVDNYKKHVGMSDTETAITNSYMIQESQKFHSKRYASMAKERPNPQDWEPEMTREEFMKDKYKYVQEAYKKERKY